MYVYWIARTVRSCFWFSITLERFWLRSDLIFLLYVDVGCRIEASKCLMKKWH